MDGTKKEQNMPETIHMTAARCMPEALETMRQWLWDFEEKLEYGVADNDEFVNWLQATYQHGLGMHWQRLIFGYETLVDNACDETKDHLAWKHDIAEKLGVDP